jgi:hypothetical protein
MASIDNIRFWATTHDAILNCGSIHRHSLPLKGIIFLSKPDTHTTMAVSELLNMTP